MHGQLDTMLNDQRPWVTLKGIGFDPPKANDFVRGEVTLTNSGRSPAIDISAKGSLFITSDHEQDLPAEEPTEDVVTQFVGTPGMDQTLRVHSSKPVTEDEVRRMQALGVRYYLFGFSWYKDAAAPNITHHLQWCVFLENGREGVTPCTGKRYKNAAD
jgi:hypothetical protein